MDDRYTSRYITVFENHQKTQRSSQIGINIDLNAKDIHSWMDSLFEGLHQYTNVIKSAKMLIKMPRIFVNELILRRLALMDTLKVIRLGLKY